MLQRLGRFQQPRDAADIARKPKRRPEETHPLRLGQRVADCE